ncbi:Uncharacterized protein PFLU_5293 [Pseudomonas [fluorescens] SBW25]|uniref:Uncharacterized protein n=1 Tax=Pseudomonas fluorescens (strain SBW25) TaxID=216595 RepID=C3K296_PSEFS|nr:Uncharacterized protein PFLU_5293 [Pseudomonas fluorescens SBW25]
MAACILGIRDQRIDRSLILHFLLSAGEDVTADKLSDLDDSLQRVSWYASNRGHRQCGCNLGLMAIRGRQ